jgi:hypothetical protein
MKYRSRWAEHVARMERQGMCTRILVGKPFGKHTRGRPRRRWEGNIIWEISCEDGWWMRLAQDHVHRWRWQKTVLDCHVWDFKYLHKEEFVFELQLVGVSQLAAYDLAYLFTWRLSVRDMAIFFVWNSCAPVSWRGTNHLHTPIKIGSCPVETLAYVVNGKVVPVLFSWAPHHEDVLEEWRYSSTHSWPRWVVSFTPRLLYLQWKSPW